MNEFLEFFKKIVDSNKKMAGLKEVLIFMTHLYNAINMKKFFKYDKEAKIDYQKYYEEIDRSQPNNLYGLIFNKAL